MIEYKKVDEKYLYYNSIIAVSVIAVTSMLVRLEYDPDTLYVQNGWWDIPSMSQYTDDVVYTQPPDRVTGIGFFEDVTDKLPSIVIDVEKRQIHILDERHIKTMKEKTGESVILLTVTFDRVFGDSATWEMLVNEMVKDNHIQKHDLDFKY